MTLSFSTLKLAVKRHLSVIGKRTYSKDGQNQFSQITVSTAEDPIFEQYLAAAAQQVEALLRQLVSTFSLTSTGFTLTLHNTRGAADFEARSEELVTTFCVLYTVGEYLAMTRPDMAQKYQSDATGAMQSLLSYVFYKEPPTSTADPFAASTSVS